jgi:predicted Na+-dependent transporter
MASNRPPSKADNIAAWLCLGFLCLATGYALVHIARAIFFGVIQTAKRTNARDIPFQWSDPDALISLAFYAVLGLITGGILVGLWATRHDKY